MRGGTPSVTTIRSSRDVRLSDFRSKTRGHPLCYLRYVVRSGSGICDSEVTNIDAPLSALRWVKAVPLVRRNYGITFIRHA